MKEEVVLVDENDNSIGSMSKLDAHKQGKLHRALSVFVFNDDNKFLLQKRALDKYHSPGLWSNTCCSHPRKNEHVSKAAERRLFEEMGIKITLEKIFHFKYKVKFENGLIENEFDHVFSGKYSGAPNINISEVSDWKWMSLSEIKKDLIVNSTRYTFWFKLIFNNFLEKLKI